MSEPEAEFTEREQKRIADLQEKIEQSRARIYNIQNRANTRDRKRRTRRLILLGTFVEEWHSRRPAEALTGTELMARMDGWLTRPADRRVFGLDPAD